MSVVIKIEGLSKKYRLGDITRRMLYEDLQRKWAKLWRREDPFAHIDGKGAEPQEAKEIWALQDVNFEVNDGDVVGIIGRNGSGKSTLLKILSRITAPTSGRALVKGRVASLLEVGTGFHAELTGRDNVYMNASILGMTKQEIDAKFDEIVEFSGVEKFIDTPVKRYSSGMLVRLAFAVAAHLEPEVLVIDEVLAVGDSAFQQKCLGRMSKVAKEGRTILFVSHQAAAVENLCTRGIVLEGGRVKFNGTQTEAISYYVNSYIPKTASLRDRTDRKGTGQIYFTGIEFRDMDGRIVNSVQSGQDIDVVLYYENKAPHVVHPGMFVRITVKTDLDVHVFIQSNYYTGQSLGSEVGERGSFVCRLKRIALPAACFRLSCLIYSAPMGGVMLDQIENAADLHVEEGDFYGSGQIPAVGYGVMLAEGGWHLESAAAPSIVPEDSAHS